MTGVTAHGNAIVIDMFDSIIIPANFDIPKGSFLLHCKQGSSGLFYGACSREIMFL